MPQRDPTKERYWRGLLFQWRGSGLSVHDFCAAQGVSVPSFYAWRREIRERDREASELRRGESSSDASPAFVKLTLDDVTMPPSIEVIISERRRLLVRAGFDADLLRQLVRLLEEPSC